MEYFMQFHWWYLLLPFVLLILFVMLFGESKGGLVVTRYTAQMAILDDRFRGCEPEADYSIFKEDQPDHIDIEIEELNLSAGEELELLLNGTAFTTIKVKKNHEAEFDHWSDGAIAFPQVQADNELLITYKGTPVLQGRFNLRR